MISYEFLEEKIKEIDIEFEKLDKFLEAIEEYSNSYISYPNTLSGALFQCLQLLLQSGNKTELFDNYVLDDMLGYWYYELEKGTKWKEGSVTLDNKDIKVETLKDVYNYYKERYNSKDKKEQG